MQAASAPLKRVIQKRIQNLLAEAILAGKLPAGSRASIDWRAGRFELASKRPEPESPESTAARVGRS
ncbi:MAG: hypothetical protein L6Q99_02670 [Planctomycetes bacterium]|nr:hypothetical protein [Planctomycetota bacterium]